MPNRCLSLAVCLVFLTCLGQPLFADITFTDFSSVAGLTLNGGAAQAGTNLQLTDGNNIVASSAWFNTTQSLAGGFETVFQFFIGGEQPVGDGVAFVIQTSGTAALGGTGGQIGYGGIVDSLAVEFDTVNNGGSDVNDNHAAFTSCGAGNANDAVSAGCGLATVDLSALITPIILGDGSTHTADILYVPGTLKLTLDGQLVLTAAITLGSKVGNPAFVGFTGATGALTSHSAILNWDLTTPGGGAVVPEPSSVTLLGLGLASMAWLTWRKRTQVKQS